MYKTAKLPLNRKRGGKKKKKRLRNITANLQLSHRGCTIHCKFRGNILLALQKHRRFAQKKPPQNKQKILPSTTECTFDLFFSCLSGGINSEYSYEDKRNSQEQKKIRKYFIQTFILLLLKIGIYIKNTHLFSDLALR